MVVLTVVPLLGCVHTVWVKPGATQAEFEQVKAACLVEGMQTVPPREHVEMVSGAYSSGSSKCKGNRCSQSSYYSPPQYATVDDNAPLRNQVIRACLYRNGWTETQVDD